MFQQVQVLLLLFMFYCFRQTDSFFLQRVLVSIKVATSKPQSITAKVTTLRTSQKGYKTSTTSSALTSSSSYSLTRADPTVRFHRKVPFYNYQPPGSRTITSLKMSEVTPAVAARTALEESGQKGEFLRKDAAWRNWIQKDDPDSRFPPEAGRYHLYVAYACPWAHRTLVVRAMKGLQSVISVTVVHPTWQRTRPNDDNDQHCGWIFGTIDPKDPDSVTRETSQLVYTNNKGEGGLFPLSYPDNTIDPFYSNSKSIRDVYERCKDEDGKYSVPILYDTKLQTIVSNESSDIIRMLNSEFNDYSSTLTPSIDLYPTELRSLIDETNEWVYKYINNGVYRCGFAKSQGAYEEAIIELTNTMDRVTDILQKQRYMCSPTQITETDVRLFVTLLRFDEVYIVYFKTNTRSIQYNDILLNYCRDIYQYPGVAGTVNMEQIKAHYFTSHPILNPYSIIPKGNTNYISLLQQPHNRDTIM